MKLWQALYNSSLYESGYITLSIHLTKKGAKKVIEKDKQREYNEWLEANKQIAQEFPYDYDQAWRVEPIKLKL